MASKDVIDTLIAEAGGEGDAGLIAAAWAIQQRAAARGQTVDQVIKSGFDGYSNPGSGAVKAQQDPRLRAKVEQIMSGVQNGSIPNPVPGADHFLSGDVSPGWSKNMKLVATIGGHRFYASGDVPQAAYGPLIPPGELPEVATALATVPTPRNAPVPVTPSIDLAQYRKNVAPSQLGPETFARLAKPQRNLGDELGMSPIPGGKQQAPLFDAGFDTRTNSMRLFSNGPADTQGVFTGASKAPAPIPRMPSAHIMGKRATDPVLQAALNARNPAQLPAPGIGSAPATRVVQSVPVARPKPSAFSYAGQERSQHPTATNITAYAYRPATVPDRLSPSAGMDVSAYPGAGPAEFNPYGAPLPAPLDVPPIVPNTSLPSSFQIAQGSGFRGPPQISGALAPRPFPRPTQFASAPKVAPVPFQRPTAVGSALSVRPMPPMPIARPGIGGPGLIAPRPMPASMPPQQPGQQVQYGLDGEMFTRQGNSGPWQRASHFGNGGIAQPMPPLMQQQLAAQAVSRSGDTSVGSQADAAAARSSGEGGRNRRY